MGTRTLTTIAVLVCQLALTACLSLRGAETISPSGYAYNEAIAQTKSEQLLLNLVRLKYRDAIVFMDVDGVTTQHQFGASFASETLLPFQRAANGSTLLIPGVSASERPTIVYKPLDSSQFAQDLLAPIAPETIVLLANSGWSIERLMACYVERLGALSNAPSASGPTPDIIPNNARFREASALLRDLQRQERLSVARVPSTDGEGADTVLQIHAGNTDACAPLQRLLKAESCDMQYALVAKGMDLDHQELFAQTRTVLGALYALSHAIDIPLSHEAQGLVTQSAVGAQETADWSTFNSGLFSVRTSPEKPETSAVTVFYRGHWYWIDDGDLDSKTTFNLLLFLLALQSAASDGVSPLLTIDAGG